MGIGTKIGAVTDALGRLPLVNDFYAQLSALELGQVVEDETRQTLRVQAGSPWASVPGPRSRPGENPTADERLDSRVRRRDH